MTDKMFRYLNHTSVEGLDLIFKVLCLICKIMIYRLPIRDSIDKILSPTYWLMSEDQDRMRDKIYAFV